jgi:hypothetical protein
MRLRDLRERRKSSRSLVGQSWTRVLSRRMSFSKPSALASPRRRRRLTQSLAVRLQPAGDPHVVLACAGALVCEAGT